MNLGDIHYLARRLRDAAREATIPPSLNPPLLPSEMVVFDDLAHHPGGRRIGDIARQTLLAQSRVSTVVSRLKRRGWVVTRIPPEDTRATEVEIRPEVLEGMKSVFAENAAPCLDRLLEGMGSKDRAVVQRGLETLLAHLRLEADEA